MTFWLIFLTTFGFAILITALVFIETWLEKRREKRRAAHAAKVAAAAAADPCPLYTTAKASNSNTHDFVDATGELDGKRTSADEYHHQCPPHRPSLTTCNTCSITEAVCVGHHESKPSSLTEPNVLRMSCQSPKQANCIDNCIDSCIDLAREVIPGTDTIPKVGQFIDTCIKVVKQKMPRSCPIETKKSNAFPNVIDSALNILKDDDNACTCTKDTDLPDARVIPKGLKKGPVCLCRPEMCPCLKQEDSSDSPWFVEPTPVIPSFHYPKSNVSGPLEENAPIRYMDAESSLPCPIEPSDEALRTEDSHEHYPDCLLGRERYDCYEHRNAIPMPPPPRTPRCVSPVGGKVVSIMPEYPNWAEEAVPRTVQRVTLVRPSPPRDSDCRPATPRVPEPGDLPISASDSHHYRYY